MALYKDIEQWKQILESQEEDKRKYDLACSEAAAEAASLDRKELEEMDEETIDFGDFGVTKSETDAEIEEKEDFEEEIDFSSYGVREAGKTAEKEAEKIDEADLREPLTKFAELLGKVVSTASLTGEDSARLNEAVDDGMTVVDAKIAVAQAARTAREDLYVDVLVDGSAFKFGLSARKEGDGCAVVFSEGNNNATKLDALVNAVAGIGCGWRDVGAFVCEAPGRELEFSKVALSTWRRGGTTLTFYFRAAKPDAKKYDGFFDSEKIDEAADGAMTVDKAKAVVAEAAKAARGDLYVDATVDGRFFKFRMSARKNGDGCAVVFSEGNNEETQFDSLVDAVAGIGCRWRDVNAFECDAGDRIEFSKVAVMPRQWRRGGKCLSFWFNTAPAKKYGGFFDSEKVDEAAVGDALADDQLDALNRVEGEIRQNDEIPLTDEDWAAIDAIEDADERLEFLKNRVKELDVSDRIRNDVDALIKQYNAQLADRIEGKAKAAKIEGDEAAFRRARQLQRKSVDAFLASDQTAPGKGYGLTPAEEKEFVDIVKNRLSFDQLVDLQNDKAEAVVELRAADAKWNDGFAAGEGIADGDDEDAGTEERRLAQDGFNQIFRVKDGDDSKAYAGKEWDNSHYQQDPLIPKDGSAKYKLPLDTDAEGRWQSLPKGRKYVKDFLKSQTGDAILDYWMFNRDAAGDADEWHGGRGADAVDAAWAAAKGKKKGADQWGMSEFVKVLNGIDPKVRREMAGELAKEAGGEKERLMVQKLFNGDLTKNELQKLGAEMGMGSDQGGRTGALTQQSDKMFYTLLACIALEMNVATDEAERLLAAARGGEKTENRNARKELYPVVMKELWDELDMPGEWHANERADKNAFAMDVSKLLIKAWDVLDGQEKADLLTRYHDVRNSQKIVKFVTGLDRDQNKRYQELVQKMREDGDRMTQEEQTELLALEYMRKKAEPVQARAKAVDDIERWGRKGADEILKHMVKTFLRGGSDNAKI